MISNNEHINTTPRNIRIEKIGSLYSIQNKIPDVIEKDPKKANIDEILIFILLPPLLFLLLQVFLSLIPSRQNIK